MLNSYYIIENDPKNVDNITRVFDEFMDFTFLGYSGNYKDSMNAVLKFLPDFLFINIDNFSSIATCQDGFTFCNELSVIMPNPPTFIALSKSTNSAYRAIKNQFFEYLLLPGNELDIRKIVLRLTKRQSHAPFDNTLCLKSYKDYFLIDIKDILFLQADNNATDFMLIDGRKISAFKTLKFFEKRLPQNFMRIHNSYIINKKHISRINFGKLTCFVNNNKLSIPFSKSYKKNLYALEQLLAQKVITG